MFNISMSKGWLLQVKDEGAVTCAQINQIDAAIRGGMGTFGETGAIGRVRFLLTNEEGGYRFAVALAGEGNNSPKFIKAIKALMRTDPGYERSTRISHVDRLPEAGLIAGYTGIILTGSYLVGCRFRDLSDGILRI